MDQLRSTVLACCVRLGLGCGAAAALWHAARAGRRLLAAVGELGPVEGTSIAGAVLAGEALIVFCCLAAGLVMAAAAAGLVLGLGRLWPERVGRRPVLAVVIAFVVVVGLVMGREMARHPALFEVAALRPDGTHGLLGVVADGIGPRVFGVALLVYGALAAAGMAAASRPALRWTWRRRRWLMPAAGLLVAATVAARALDRAAGTNGGPNVLVLAADSLRADHLSGNGYGRDTSPHIDTLLRDGVSWTDVYTTQARTIPSWTSALTGLTPPEHGISTMFPSAEARRLLAPTVPRLLGAAGVHTAVVSDYAGDFFSLVDYGFAEQRVPPAMTAALVAQRELVLAAPALLPFINNALGRLLLPVLRFLPNNADPAALTSDLLATLERARQHERFFVVAFYSVTHIPYAAPSPHHRRYGRPGYRGENRYSFALRELADLKRADRDLPEAEVHQAVALYDGAVHAFDRSVGQVLDYLRRTGLDRTTTVMVMSDHGEVLRGGARGMQHGNALTDIDDLRMTMIARAPGWARAAGRREPALHSAIDLAPTWLAMFGLPTTPGMRGVPLVEGGQPSTRAAPAAYVETGEWLSTRPRPEAPDYPLVGALLGTDEDGHLTIRPRHRALVEEARHRGVLDPDWLLALEPGRAGWRLEPRSAAARAALADEQARRIAGRRLLRALERELEALPGGGLDRRRRTLAHGFDQE